MVWSAGVEAFGRLRVGDGFGVAVGEEAGVGVDLGFFLKSRWNKLGVSFSTGSARGMTGVGEDCALKIAVERLLKSTNRRHFLKYAETEVNTAKW